MDNHRNSSNSGRNPNPLGTESSGFTIDTTDGSEEGMPSVTRLLNRKSLQGLANSKPPAQPPPPPPPPSLSLSPSSPDHFEVESTPSIVSDPSVSSAGDSDQPSVSLSLDAGDPNLTAQPVLTSFQTSAPKIKPVLKVQPAIRKATAKASSLAIWQPDQLSSSPEPLKKAVHHLLNLGGKSVLLLSIEPTPSGAPGAFGKGTPTQPLPIFVSSAAVEPQLNREIWSGLKWNPSLFFQIWDELIKTGSVEFPPSSSMPHPAGHPTVIRAAFGVQGKEWLLLLRVGPSQSCRGILAVLSKQSLRPRIPEIRAMLAQIL